MSTVAEETPQGSENSAQEKQANLARAKLILRGRREAPKEVFKLAKQLADTNLMQYAWKLAQHLAEGGLDAELGPQVRQKWALWHSKDAALSEDTKHDRALEILDGIKQLEDGKSLANTRDCETLGIAGGICKRKWLANGQRRDLEKSLAYYERGYAEGVEKDIGYTGINAAFIHELLAHLDGRSSPGSVERLQRAQQIREEILELLPSLEDQPAWDGGPPLRTLWWYQATLAEAEFGLGDGGYERAGTRLAGARETTKPPPWELETTARQLTWLASLKDPEAKTLADMEASPPWRAIHTAFGGKLAAGAGALFLGKFGLALSGGGFRASFFHIGVLAALAEQHLLRHIEVLSCVSGGSIVGAHYYLKVRRLLENNPDGTIEQSDYLTLVEDLAKEFLHGVEKNLRTRLALNPLPNLRMMFDPRYSQTNRLGRLIEHHLYRRAEPDKERRRYMRNLLVAPKDTESFMPQYENWQRLNKVPILVLNATCLNTGHNWQFTASFMGEPGSVIKTHIDRNSHLPRKYYDDLGRRGRVRLGDAVAASACVPGIFAPITLPGIHDQHTVRLVDGGVHDNQGVLGLLEQNCRVMLVSDASGQMHTDYDPDPSMLAVPMRSNSILQSRVRSAQFGELDTRLRTGLVKKVMFVHLRENISAEGPQGPSSLTPYGIRRDIQDHLAQIRTDLDSFSETEAYSLMTSGYKMARHVIPQVLEGFPIQEKQHAWEFLNVSEKLAAESGNEWILKLLRTGRYPGFKVWRLSRVLRAFLALLSAAALLGLWRVLGSADVSWQSSTSLVGTVLIWALAAGVALAVLHVALRVFKIRKPMTQLALGLALSLGGWLAALVHLAWFDRRFLSLGRLKNVLRRA